MNAKLIGIVGYLGSGKSTLSEAAIHRPELEGKVIRIGFSDPMHSMFAAMGVPEYILNNKVRWNDPLAILAGNTLRHAFKTLGTEWGRNCIGQDVWTNLALTRANSFIIRGQSVIIDNIRFPSEFEAMAANGARMIALHKPDLVPNLEHESEKHIHHLQERCSHSVINDGTFNQGVLRMASVLIEMLT